MPPLSAHPPSDRRRLWSAPGIFAFLTALLLSACSHYQLGTGAKPGFQTLYVAPVDNKTLLPQAREIISTQIREAFARDGRVALAASPDSADATLAITITDYHRVVAAVREGDTGLARKFNLVLAVDCTLTRRDGTVLFSKRRVTAQREAFTDSGQLQAEYQAVPLLAEDIAKNVTHVALDVW